MSKAKELDKYYTNSDVAISCAEELKKVFNVYSLDWIEPSAGNGSFLLDFVTHAYDIYPEREDILQKDWFNVKPTNYYGLIGNPPFGKRNALSKAFIKKAVKDDYCKCIAFVLPSVYNKHTLQKVFPASWKLIVNKELSSESFTFEGKPYRIPSVFQVWVEYSDLLDLRAVERKDFCNKHFSICNKEEADLFVMGASCNTVKYPKDVSSNNRGYYLKAKDLTVEKLKSNIESINWKGFSCANGGVSWLTKTEFMNQYEENYNECKQQE